jgi:hypothetical protein
LRQIPQLVAGRLRQQVVGDPHAEVAAAGELHDGGVVAGSCCDPPTASIALVIPNLLSSPKK